MPLGPLVLIPFTARLVTQAGWEIRWSKSATLERDLRTQSLCIMIPMLAIMLLNAGEFVFNIWFGFFYGLIYWIAGDGTRLINTAVMLLVAGRIYLILRKRADDEKYAIAKSLPFRFAATMLIVAVTISLSALLATWTVFAYSVG